MGALMLPGSSSNVGKSVPGATRHANAPVSHKQRTQRTARLMSYAMHMGETPSYRNIR